jgi:hypothetical protein
MMVVMMMMLEKVDLGRDLVSSLYLLKAVGGESDGRALRLPLHRLGMQLW